MSYQVRLRREAQKNLDGLPGHELQPIFSAVRSLGSEPRPNGTKKLRGSGLWRVRVGDFRIVYAIDDGTRVVVVTRIARRSEGTYKNL